MRVCLFDAIAMGPDGFPVVDEKKCVGCGMCAHVCPRGVLKLENQPIRWKAGEPIRVYAVDL